MKAIGVILIIIGLAMIIFNEVDFTKKEKVADIGPLEVNKNETHHIRWPDYAGIVVIIAGIAVLVVPRMKK